jgi:hypothetical protein
MAQPLWPHLGQILALISLGQQPRECAMSDCLFVLACLPPSWATTCCSLTLSVLMSSRSLMSLASSGIEIEALSGLSNTDTPLRPALALMIAYTSVVDAVCVHKCARCTHLRHACILQVFQVDHVPGQRGRHSHQPLRPLALLANPPLVSYRTAADPPRRDAFGR